MKVKYMAAAGVLAVVLPLGAFYNFARSEEKAASVNSFPSRDTIEPLEKRQIKEISEEKSTADSKMKKEQLKPASQPENPVSKPSAREQENPSKKAKQSAAGKPVPKEAPQPPKTVKAPEPPKKDVSSPPPKSAAKAPAPAEPKQAKKVYYSAETSEKLIALTFDDGPDKNYTPLILDILKENEIKGTFFIIGKNAKENPEVLQRIAAEGHAIGNHTWDHINVAKAAPPELKKQLLSTSQLIHTLTGQKDTIMRAPFGALSENASSEINRLGYSIVQWDVDTRDWAGTESGKIVSVVKAGTKSGSIILMHSAGGKGGKLDNTVAALPALIADLKQQGYQFITVNDLLGFKQ